MKAKIYYIIFISVVVIIVTSGYNFSLQKKMFPLLKVVYKELVKSAGYMEESVKALKPSKSLFNLNKESTKLTKKTVVGMQLTSKLVKEALQMQENSIKDLKKTIKLSLASKKQMQILNNNTKILYDLALKTSKQSKVFEDFAYYSNQAAKESLELGEDSLKIIMGEKKFLIKNFKF